MLLHALTPGRHLKPTTSTLDPRFFDRTNFRRDWQCSSTRWSFHSLQKAPRPEHANQRISQYADLTSALKEIASIEKYLFGREKSYWRDYLVHIQDTWELLKERRGTVDAVDFVVAYDAGVRAMVASHEPMYASLNSTLSIFRRPGRNNRISRHASKLSPKRQPKLSPKGQTVRRCLGSHGFDSLILGAAVTPHNANRHSGSQWPTFTILLSCDSCLSAPSRRMASPDLKAFRNTLPISTTLCALSPPTQFAVQRRFGKQDILDDHDSS